MKEQQIKKVYYNGKQYTKAYCNGQLIWSVMERPQDDNEGFLNVFDIEIQKCYHPKRDIVLHNLFGTGLKTEVNGSLLCNDDCTDEKIILPLNVDPNEDVTKYRIRTNGYINSGYGDSSRLFVTRIDKISLPQITDVPVEKQDSLRKYSPVLLGMCNLRYANLSYLDLSNCESCNGMFSGLNGLVNYEKVGYDKCEIVGTEFVQLYSPTDVNSMFALSRLDIDDFNWVSTKNVKNMYQCFMNYKNQKLHLESWDTHSVVRCDNMFKGVKNCKIYVGEKWTLNTDSDAYGGKDLVFVRV